MIHQATMVHPLIKDKATYSTVTSVLLFCALPSSVSLVDTGLVSP